jgi:hypothetical protein
MIYDFDYDNDKIYFNGDEYSWSEYSSLDDFIKKEIFPNENEKYYIYEERRDVTVFTEEHCSYEDFEQIIMDFVIAYTDIDIEKNQDKIREVAKLLYKEYNKVCPLEFYTQGDWTLYELTGLFEHEIIELLGGIHEEY